MWFKSEWPCLFIQLYYLLHIMYSLKWMASAFINVRVAKAKIVFTKKVTEALDAQLLNVHREIHQIRV